LFICNNYGYLKDLLRYPFWFAHTFTHTSVNKIDEKFDLFRRKALSQNLMPFFI
jgi:hypothetical protein